MFLCPVKATLVSKAWSRDQRQGPSLAPSLQSAHSLGQSQQTDVCKGGSKGTPGTGAPQRPQQPLFSLDVLSFLGPLVPQTMSTSPQGWK